MPTLRERVVMQSQDNQDLGGFDLPEPPTTHFKSPELFLQALDHQLSVVATRDANLLLRSINLRGSITGTDLSLSRAAFGDMCNASRIPSQFIRLLAKIDETQALDVVETMLRSVFKNGPPKLLVIDEEARRVEGIVGAESYSPVSNKEVAEYALSAGPYKMTNGWLCGPRMRLTVVNDEQPLEVKKGDIVRCGVNLENSIHGDQSLKVADYLERLVCTNGAVAREGGREACIIHRGDVKHSAQSAIVASAQRACTLFDLVQRSAGQLMLPPVIRGVRAFIKENKNGGNPTLEQAVVRAAKNEAAKAGRMPEETYLFDWFNAVTAQAHTTPSMQRKTEIESLGVRVLTSFCEA